MEGTGKIIPRIATAGDLPNDKVTRCEICKENGWPHEPITFSKVYGRILSDGSRELLGHKAIDYVTDRPHEHKQQKRFYKGWDLEALIS